MKETFKQYAFTIKPSDDKRLADVANELDLTIMEARRQAFLYGIDRMETLVKTAKIVGKL